MKEDCFYRKKKPKNLENISSKNVSIPAQSRQGLVIVSKAWEFGTSGLEVNCSGLNCILVRRDRYRQERQEAEGRQGSGHLKEKCCLFLFGGKQRNAQTSPTMVTQLSRSTKPTHIHCVHTQHYYTSACALSLEGSDTTVECGIELACVLYCVADESDGSKSVDGSDEEMETESTVATTSNLPRRTRAQAAAAAAQSTAVAPTTDDKINAPAPSSSASPSSALPLSSSSSSLPAGSSASEEPVATVLYVQSGLLPKLTKYIGKLLEMRIPSKYLNSRNREVVLRQLWGTEVYTDDSDVIAILQHSGKILLRPTMPPEHIGGVVTYLRVLPAASRYASSERYGIKSRAWGPGYHRCSLQVVRCEWVGPSLSLRPAAVQSGAVAITTQPPEKKQKKEEQKEASAPASANPAATESGSSAVTASKKDPKTLKMLLVDRTVAGGRQVPKKKKHIPDHFIVFDHHNEPAYLYNLMHVQDLSIDEAQWTSTRLRAECIYVESNNCIYELARLPGPLEPPPTWIETNSGSTARFDKYRFAMLLDSYGTVWENFNPKTRESDQHSTFH